MEISILCKVVDNFGDIGVAWRMARRFVELDCNLIINLIVDGLASFAKIESSIDEKKTLQKIQNVYVYDWNDFDNCYKEFSKNDGEKLYFIIECFQCGRPLWLEKILFEDKLERTVHILMIDYLTAEKYAEDFHKLPSLTRSAKVQKINFMPGFTDKTGGLIIEKTWEFLPERQINGPVLFFTYEKDWDAVAKSVCECSSNKIFAANGVGFASVNSSFANVLRENFEKRFVEISFCNQKEWDKILCSSSVLFIRGEESLSRACLSGIPFVWHAYVQSEEYQLVKVKALLSLLKKYFSEPDYLIVERLWILINTSDNSDYDEMKSACDDFMKNLDKLAENFANFAKDLRKNGDLCLNVMTFIKKNYIMV